MFEGRPTYPKYRTLLLAEPQLRGEDVFALQTGLDDVLARNNIGRVEADGIFGPATDKAVHQAQKVLETTMDGKVGSKTWERIGNNVAIVARAEHDIATGLLYGQLSHESGFRGGIYSEINVDGSWDAGMSQLNSRVYPDLEISFMVPDAVGIMAKNTRDYYELFAGVKGLRRWALAAGAHNAPAFACRMALEEGATNRIELQKRASSSLGPESRSKLEAYIASVTAYLR